MTRRERGKLGRPFARRYKEKKESQVIKRLYDRAKKENLLDHRSEPRGKKARRFSRSKKRNVPVLIGEEEPTGSIYLFYKQEGTTLSGRGGKRDLSSRREEKREGRLYSARERRVGSLPPRGRGKK